MQLENELRAKMKSKLYSLLSDKYKKDSYPGYYSLPYENKDYSFEVKLKEPAKFDEVSRILEKTAMESNLGYARLGLNAGAEFGLVYFKKPEMKLYKYMDKIFNPASGIADNAFIKTGFYAVTDEIESIHLICSNPKAHKKELVNFFLDLYHNINGKRQVALDQYIK